MGESPAKGWVDGCVPFRIRLDIVVTRYKVPPGFAYASEAFNVTHTRVCFPSHARIDCGYGPENSRRQSWRRLCYEGKWCSTCALEWAGSNTRAVETRFERAGSDTSALEKRLVRMGYGHDQYKAVKHS